MAYTWNTATNTAWNSAAVPTTDTFNRYDNNLLHLKEQSGLYATASGTGGTYAVTCIPAPAAYFDGMLLAVKINATNTGSCTMNANTRGAIAIKRADGGDPGAGQLNQSAIYTMRYSNSTFFLQGEGGYGDAIAHDLMYGKIATVPSGIITGTLTIPHGSEVTTTPGTHTFTVPTDVTKLSFVAVGAGGGGSGGGGNNLGGSGGGGGGRYTDIISVTPGGTLTVVVGVGGTGGANFGGTGGAGASSSVAANIAAGGGGGSYSGNGGAGGAGGAGAVYGGAGGAGAGNTGGTGGTGGTSASDTGGTGGAGAANGGIGNNGSGGGGGGGSGGIGGAGGAGKVVLSW